ncbi:MAG: hypothetical protein IJ364_09275, partial [Oscillospiraceae bacterium]|nr:hypothetical protein [Oscillospiraceae bacterium]
MKKMRNICSLFMVLVMLFSCIPMTAFAEETLPEPVETPEIPEVPEKTAVDFMQWLEDPLPVIFQSDADIDMQYYLRMAYGIPEEISFVCEPAVVSYSQYFDGDYFPLTVTATGDHEGSCTVTAEVYSANVSSIANHLNMVLTLWSAVDEKNTTFPSRDSTDESTQTWDVSTDVVDDIYVDITSNYGEYNPNSVRGYAQSSSIISSDSTLSYSSTLSDDDSDVGRVSFHNAEGFGKVKIRFRMKGVMDNFSDYGTGKVRDIYVNLSLKGRGVAEESKEVARSAVSQTLKVELKNDAGLYDISWKKNGSAVSNANGAELSITNPVVGDTYVATIKYKTQGLCTGSESWTQTFSISNKAQWTTMPKGLELVYNGDRQRVLEPGSTNEGTIHWEIYLDVYLGWLSLGEWNPVGYVGMLDDVDQLRARFRIVGDGNHLDSDWVEVTGKIVPAVPAYTAPTAISGLTYTGANQPLVNPGTATGAKLQYSLDNAGWADGIPTGKDAGSYTVYYRIIAQDSNYKNVTPENNSVSVSIAPKNGTPAVTAPVAASLSYNGKAQNLLKSKGSSEGGGLVYAVTAADAADAPEASLFKTTAEATDAGMYKIWYKAEKDNYSSNPVYSITAEIGKLDISNGTPVLKASPVYTGKELTQEIESLTVGDVSVDLGELTISGNTATNVGAQNYALTVEAGSSANLTGSLSAQWNIQPCPISITPNSVSKVYGEDEPVFSEYTANGVPEMGAVITDISISRETGENVGEYKLTASQPEGKNLNYEITFNEGVFEITPKELTVNVVIADKNYDGKCHAAISSAQLMGVLNKDEGKIAIDNTAPAEAMFKTAQVGSGIEVELVKGFSLSGDEQTVKNYTLLQPENIKGNIVNNWTAAEYTVSPATSEYSWSAGDVSIIAAEGYLIGSGNTAEDAFEDKIVYSGETAAEGAKAQFYLKNKTSGAISLMAEETYFVDKTNPTGSITFGELEGWSGLLNDISFGLIFKDKLSVSIKAEDSLSGVKSIEYLRSESVFTDESIKTAQGWQEYNGTMTVEAKDAERFVYYARLSDHAGNVSYLSTQGAVFDTEAPRTDFDASQVYYTTQEVEFSDVNLLKVNGETVSASTGSVTLAGNVDKVYTVTAEDKAGNKTEISVTMKPVENLDTVADTVTADTVTLEDAAGIRAVLQKV